MNFAEPMMAEEKADTTYFLAGDLGPNRLNVEFYDGKKFLIEWLSIRGIRTPVMGYKVIREDAKGYHCRKANKIDLARMCGNYFYTPKV